jgi:hypothetical protein
MFNTRHGLTFQQFPKKSFLVKRFLQGHQVLNLMEGDQQPIQNLIHSSGHAYLNKENVVGVWNPNLGCLDP